MAYAERGSLAWDHRVKFVLERFGGLGLIGVLGVSVLGVAAGGPEWLGARHVAAAVLAYSGGLVGCQYVLRERTLTRNWYEPARFGLQLLALAGLGYVLHLSQTPGYEIGFRRTAAATNALLLVVAYCVLARDPREYSVLHWLAFGCLATILAIFFYHGRTLPVTSPQARQPLWWGSIMAIGIAVIPQYLPREAFLWALNRFAAGLVMVALPVSIVGEYTLFGLSVGGMGAATIPVVGVELPVARSLFGTRSAFGVVAFAGVVAALAELLRTYVTVRPAWWWLVPLALLALNTVGLALAASPVLWVLALLAGSVYLGYLLFGWRGAPIAVLGGVVALVAGIGGVHTGLLPMSEDTPTWIHRWAPAASAVLDNPSLIGAGLVDPAESIAAAHPSRSAGHPHNAYLTMAIRAGWLGGFLYGVLIATSLLAGIDETITGDGVARVGVLALGVGFAAHQLFAALTLFGWHSSSMLAALVFGFLIFGQTTTDSDPVLESATPVTARRP